MNTRSRRRDDEARGFTLIEVLVALAILALALGAIFPIYANSIQRQVMITDEDTAISLAKSKLDALGSEIPLNVGATEGVFANGFTWRVVIAGYANAAPGSLLATKRATVTIGWQGKKAPRSLTIETIRVVGREPGR